MHIEIIAEEIKGIKARLSAIEKAIAAPPPVGAHTIDPAEMKQCEEFWLATLEHFKVPRPILPHDQRALFDFVKAHGFAAVCYAIYGMRFEPKTSTFDPADHLTLQRLHDPKLFDKFVNIGARKRAADKKKGVA